MKALLFTLIIFCSSFSWAALRDRRAPDGRPLMDVLVANGAPQKAVELMFHFYDYNWGRINNWNWAVIVDFSKPSTQKRFLLLDLNSGNIETHYVSHGMKSGILEARYFSNSLDSQQSSLGFFYAVGDGAELPLYGIDSSNNKARKRNMSLLGASYATDAFIQKYGRLGWSRGDLAMDPSVVIRIADILREGSVILAFHPALMLHSRKATIWQDLLGQESVPGNVRVSKTPEE